MDRRLTSSIRLLLSIVWSIGCSGCGIMRQALSPDLHKLVNQYGVVTIPNRDDTIIFQDKPIDDNEFAKAFKNVKGYGGVRTLDLNGQPISDSSIPLILQLKKLEVLQLQGTKITLAGFQQLRSLRHLKTLFIEDLRFTTQQV